MLYLQKGKLQITVDSGLECDLDLEVEIKTKAEGVALAVTITAAAAASNAAEGACGTTNEALSSLGSTAAEKTVGHTAEWTTTTLLLLLLDLLLAATLLRRLRRHVLFALVCVGHDCGLGLGFATTTAATASRAGGACWTLAHGRHYYGWVLVRLVDVVE